MRKIPYSRVSCEGNELAYVREVLQSGWLTTAGKARELEARFAEAVGGQYACAVNSCTAALHLAMEAIGIGRGDRVFVPTMTFTASEVRRRTCFPDCRRESWTSAARTVSGWWRTPPTHSRRGTRAAWSAPSGMRRASVSMRTSPSPPARAACWCPTTRPW